MPVTHTHIDKETRAYTRPPQFACLYGKLKMCYVDKHIDLYMLLFITHFYYISLLLFIIRMN